MYCTFSVDDCHSGLNSLPANQIMALISSLMIHQYECWWVGHSFENLTALNALVFSWRSGTKIRYIRCWICLIHWRFVFAIFSMISSIIKYSKSVLVRWATSCIHAGTWICNKRNNILLVLYRLCLFIPFAWYLNLPIGSDWYSFILCKRFGPHTSIISAVGNRWLARRTFITSFNPNPLYSLYDISFYLAFIVLNHMICNCHFRTVLYMNVCEYPGKTCPAYNYFHLLSYVLSKTLIQ